ncbi:MAG: LysM peptidoglycan-binding domain-containing protein, partial [Chloroflexota bacterium]
GNDPAPTLTPTPLPWTESNPLASAEQIQSVLNDLAQKNINAFHTSAWVHVVRTDQAQPGMIHSSYSESWTRYPRDNRSCAESLSFTSDRPGAANFLQIIVGLPDGTIGDLIQLRSGEAQVPRLEPGADSCSLAPEFTAAGQFAFRLNREQAASPQKNVDAQAWYSKQGGQVVFNVAVTFTQPSKANMGITKETRSFDIETGTVLQEGIRAEWEDGSVFSETLQGYETSFLPELPADVAAQFEQYTAELKSYASGTAPHPSETPLPASFNYTVRAGDTCGRLAVTYNVSVQSIVTQNNLPSACIISAGQKLKIPYPTPTPTGILNEATQTAQACEKIPYTVQANDTLASIAVKYNVPPDAIKRYNGLSTDTIFWGQPLIIPICERSTVTPAPSQASETSPGFVVYDQQFIPETNPITDGGTILQILQDLKRLQIERLSRPGWYVYGPASPDPLDWMSNYYLLTHTLDQSSACEFMNYYIKDGRILPQQLVLSDGRWGQISVAEEGVEPGTVTFAETGKINWNNGPMTDTCQVQNTETISFIQNETRTFQEIVDGKTQGTYKAWTEEVGGRKVFVLYYELTGDGLGHVMDPETRKLEPIDRTQTWEYFDLNWGTVLSEVGERIFFLQNGKTIGSAPAADKKIDFGYTYYKELPADLEEIFEKTVADLEAYLKK